ncbi:MAG: hypothetical protein HF314_04645 [Ignavibacteria bacterium]|jgi:hypothetical protein|nr:hypothetical protein [Ignavibacteria bacterium]MCU7502339.1 hypothetical protein [Ignavibacteria bacterium]MCU7515096.1 hypothetical protein [Ignavibacteria bacterium]
MINKKLLSSDEIQEIMPELGLEFAVVHNPALVYPETELLPLAPKITAPQKELSAVVLDLEGAACTTVDLRLHSLEYVIRSISGRLSRDEWKGLDPLLDYPNLLGISVSEQIRYLIQRYHNFIKSDQMKDAYFNSVLWTSILSHDEERKLEAGHSLEYFGLQDMLKDSKFNELVIQKEFNKYNSNIITNYFVHKYGSLLNLQNFENSIRAAAEIFYRHYHQTLELIKYGEGSNLAEKLTGKSDMPLIRPLASVSLLFALVKGWLGEEVDYLFDELNQELKLKSSQVYRISSPAEARLKLKKLGRHFETHPVKIALATSSASYEAGIVLEELFNVISHEIRKWKLPQAKKDLLLGKFSDFRNVVDVFVTGSQSSKMRPKPHRDLFSLALGKLGLPRSMFHQVLGFEDSENGIIALRASGIGLAAAVPFAKSTRNDFSAAAFILPGGISEAILNHDLFISL